MTDMQAFDELDFDEQREAYENRLDDIATLRARIAQLEAVEEAAKILKRAIGYSSYVPVDAYRYFCAALEK